MGRTTAGAAHGGDGGNGGNGSSILQVLAGTPAAALEEELRRLEREQPAGSHHREADYLAMGRVR